jgi:dTDP-4-dehydrorhamnose reductase
MLGHVVCRYLEENGWSVLFTNERFSQQRARLFVEGIKALEPDWCINCAGIRAEDCEEDHLFEVNTALPTECVERLRGSTRFLHASSDGVFREDRPARSVLDSPDARDPYGISKARAEDAVLTHGGYVIRCSVIGPELRSHRSLLSWFLAQNAPVFGYVNQFWNGITTLEWARLALRIMTGAFSGGCLVQPGVWPAVSKADVLQSIARIWGHNIPIAFRESPRNVARTLIPSAPWAGLNEQLDNLHGWYSKGKIEY